MREIILYTTVGCHLCEQALALLLRANEDGAGLTICQVEISDSESLMQAYGIRIPVIKLADANTELGWPFTYPELQDFLQTND